MDKYGLAGGVPYRMRDTGEYYFGAYDLANALGFPNASAAVRRFSSLLNYNVLVAGQKTLDYNGLLAMAKAAPKSARKFIREFQAVLKRNRNPEPALPDGIPDFSDPAVAARAWAEQYEMRQIADKTVGYLEECLGNGAKYKIVRAIPWIDEVFKPDCKYLNSVVGLMLARLSKEMKLPKKPMIGIGPFWNLKLSLYHVDVIREFKSRLDANPELMKNFRKSPNPKAPVAAGSHQKKSAGSRKKLRGNKTV